MLRVSTIYASSARSAAAYYTKYLAEAPGEVPGVWTGRQAAGLGLGLEVAGEDLQTLLEGRDPATGTPLGRALTDRELADGTVVRAVAGFDATFSAPKSLSVWWALTQDDRILTAHDVAVRAALAHLERFGATTRVRVQGGRLHPDTQGLTMAVFRQTTSRADDPQLHSHVVVSAKVQTVDGRWMALDARYLKRHQRMLGGLYQSVLRNELTHRFGVAWESIEHGQAEIVGVPAELRDVFSKRSSQIERLVTVKRTEFVRAQGREPTRWELAALTREAAVDTRSKKTGHGVAELVTRWQAEAATLGWSAANLTAAVADAGTHQLGEPPAVRRDEVLAALSAAGSTWNRADVLSTVCDLARPSLDMDGQLWAQQLEAATDEVASGCVELDPDRQADPRRRSDGRSLWLEPTAAHLSAEAIVREEEFVLSWALNAQSSEAAPSDSVDTTGLDVFQADAAASVAGQDRLVLVVGPAGTGKTTTLRAAVADLHRAGHTVFGVAPSAMAARVLERETGVTADTLAKLLHEWSRTDRPPNTRCLLPAGATVLVDEAGMVGTPALARLVALAGKQRWRLVLVGDPYQLQAVGRGGLLMELCDRERSHQLERIHRFDNGWEATASLQLRRGDPAGWDAYLNRGRIVAGSFDEHVATATRRWLEVTDTGDTVAVVATTNEHVDALNAAIQIARVARGDLDASRRVSIGGGEIAMVGDHVVTRRNTRHLTTGTGEPIRNREHWIVTALGADGSLAVASADGLRRARLPVEYVAAHVRLGYAATEHGIQGDTTTVGITLVSTATTRRGAYVGVTRGRRDNTVLVVTDSHDLDEARDVLERVITLDRADIPATTQRRHLAATTPIPPTPPRLRHTPRASIPYWLPDLQTRIARDLADAERRTATQQHQRDDLHRQLAAAEDDLARARRRLNSYRPSLAGAGEDVLAAQRELQTATRIADHAGLFRRRGAQQNARTAEANVRTAQQREARVRAEAAPALDDVNDAAATIERLRADIKTAAILDQWNPNATRLAELQALQAAVQDWQHWAAGKLLHNDRIAAMATILRTFASDGSPECHQLAASLGQATAAHGIDPELSLRSRSIGIER